MPRWEAADRIITGTTLGEHDRLRGPFGDNADTRVPVRPGRAASAPPLFIRYATRCPTVTSPAPSPYDVETATTESSAM
jgi:hypothetical protein